jgi:hypothetical protein
LDNEFTNQLFEQLNAPFNFPNPKEAGGSLSWALLSENLKIGEVCSE